MPPVPDELLAPPVPVLEAELLLELVVELLLALELLALELLAPPVPPPDALELLAPPVAPLDALELGAPPVAPLDALELGAPPGPPLDALELLVVELLAPPGPPLDALELAVVLPAPVSVACEPPQPARKTRITEAPAAHRSFMTRDGNPSPPHAGVAVGWHTHGSFVLIVLCEDGGAEP